MTIEYGGKLPAGTIKRIHVNQHVIKENLKNGTNKPCITVKCGSRNIYGTDVTINGPTKVIQNLTDGLSCGAKVWMETEAAVTIHPENHE